LWYDFVIREFLNTLKDFSPGSDALSFTQTLTEGESSVPGMHIDSFKGIERILIK